MLFKDLAEGERARDVPEIREGRRIRFLRYNGDIFAFPVQGPDIVGEDVVVYGGERYRE